MDQPALPSRRSMLKTAALAGASVGGGTAALASPGGEELLRPVESPRRASGDPWRGLKVGVASYSLRKLSLDDAIKGVQRVGLAYVSIKDFHLPMNSNPDERKAVARRFRDAG